MPTRAQIAADEMLRYMSAASSRRADQAIETLAASGGASRPGSERRREPRELYSGQVSIKVAVRTAASASGGVNRQVCVEVFARNLSKSGFGFVAPPIYLPEAGSDSRIAIRGNDVFQAGKLVQIAVVRAEGLTNWMPGRVLRARLVDDGFVECGVEFV